MCFTAQNLAQFWLESKTTEKTMVCEIFQSISHVIIPHYIYIYIIILYYVILLYYVIILLYYYIIILYYVYIYINSHWKPHIFLVQATFFQRFATLSRGKVHLLAACQAERSRKWDDPWSWYSLFVNGRTRRELQIYHDLSSIFSVI